MAAVLHPAKGQAGTGELGGFVLMLDNITRAFEQDSLRDQMLHDLTEGSRAALANLQAAVEMLELPDLEPGMRDRFLAVIRDEVAALSARVQRLAADAGRQLKTSWPLDDMLGADLVAAAHRRIQAAHGLEVDAAEVDADLWLRVESFSLLQALTSLAGSLSAELGVTEARLRLAGAGGRAELDLAWTGEAPGTETVANWLNHPMGTGQGSAPLTVRDIVERHQGEVWFERERSGDGGLFRFLLPVAEDRDEAQAPLPDLESRPEYYDFDLFQTSPQTSRLDDRELGELSYTVFDTETTGLDPSAGDEIIQIGATRIVNGKLLQGESFIQLIDPQRPVSQASALIHGLKRDMLAGQPTISEVLPAFHAYASDTVLVAHNAAFDMRFLELKQDLTGVNFDQPVLDTLLLSAAVHPNQDSHSLEAIAQRLDVPVRERHTALGDAMITAEVFLRLIPLLQDRGIRTLGQARAVAQQTYYARLKY
jgi:DNA polymerase-3 subunit epsilon